MSEPGINSAPLESADGPIRSHADATCRHTKAIVITALITLVVSVVATIGFVTYQITKHPPTPVLKFPKSMRVMVYPCDVCDRGYAETEIPENKLDFAFRLVTPGGYAEGGIHEYIDPLVARVVHIDTDGKETMILVRWSGKNPAFVTVDGRKYFYGRNDPDIHDGAMQLVGLVGDIHASTGK